MMHKKTLPPVRVGIACRCGDDVSRCERGCTLFACCGGYVREGHMSDCRRASDLHVHGKHSRPSYTG
jgi:hypothetical protein